MERNVYKEPEDKVLLRTKDVYQTEAEDDVTAYSDRLLSIVADFKNSGRPEGFNAQSMVGKSKRGEVACRLFARIDPVTGIIEAAGFKARGCLAMTACASAACILIEGKPIEEALAIDVEAIRAFVDGVPAGKVNALHFAACAIKALIGDFLMRDGAGLDELIEATQCDPDSISCIMAEHCSFRSTMNEMRAEELARKQALAENNAYADCFDLVRQQSAQSKLTTPEDWTALVPAHMRPAEFSAKVLEQLDEDCEVLGTSSDHTQAGEPPKPSRFANRGVGVPSRFQKKGDVENLGRHNTMAETERVFQPPVQEDSDNDAELIPPEGYRLVEVDGTLCLVESDEEPEEKMLPIKSQGIKLIRGKEKPYLYDGEIMTATFARWAFLAAEDDPLTTFSYCVREDSRTYPRPMARSSFANHPFHLDAAAVEALWEQAQGLEEYADLKRIEASNGDVYYFSTDHLSEEHAQSLAEWASVERSYNV